jgi:transcription elongation factor Elf1
VNHEKTPISSLTKPVDIYCEWIDMCTAKQQGKGLGIQKDGDDSDEPDLAFMN